MPHRVRHREIRVKGHPGSTEEEIAREPDWTGRHHHRVGYRNKDDRKPGLTHQDDELEKDVEELKRERDIIARQVKAGHLVNFRELVEWQDDFHLRHPENQALGWRYVLDATEDWVKNEQQWPANIQKQQAEAEKKKQEEQSQGDKTKQTNSDQRMDGIVNGDAAEREMPEYTTQQKAFLEALQHDKDYISQLKINNGKHKSPQTKNRTTISIDVQDQFSPDNWLPRSSDLIRLTGKHPLNAEAPLTKLLDAGLITPNELHYVRNHGSVPKLLWAFHKLDIEYNGKTTSLSMDQLKDNYESINIPVALACDGNRRGELNMIRKSKGFNWGAGGVSCAYWKGPLLRDVLLSAGIPEKIPTKKEGERYWVNFAGADSPSEGTYETCIPFDYAMDATNDVMLAYQMNDLWLPPDHGSPVRLLVPGFVGGRCVKWLKRIWITDKENDSYYHIWDNRVLPSFVTEKDGAFSKLLFSHPSTACNEQNLNSVIVRPEHGEKIPFSAARKGKTYRIAGFAYDGGGHEVQRVEVSLDDGENWLYCIRKFPDYPIRHGRKFWTWLHWHVDVEIAELFKAKSITVRCFNVFKNTQPEHPNWNIMGMMNNCWFVVKPEICEDDDSEVPSILFKHPTVPAVGEGGWMQPSEEIRIANAKQEAGTPGKQFTREEIEKHCTEDDCWLVIDGKVYDTTSVMSWHPGGKAAILAHAGKLHQETTEEFASIHDGYAYQKLKECILGTVTDKALKFIKTSAEEAAKERAASQAAAGQLTLQKNRWVPVKLIDRQNVSKDTRIYTFAVPDAKVELGLGTCQHVQIGFHMKDRMLIRSYTPTRPFLPASKDGGGPDETDEKGRSIRDGDGTFDLVVKTYFPDANQPGGAMSNILDVIPLGEEVEIRGPTGEITYEGQGRFTIEGKERHFKRVSLVLGGSGVTPGYALIARMLLDEADRTELRIIDANRSEDDILMRAELDRFAREHADQMRITHVLSNPSDAWQGPRGRVNPDLIRQSIFEPAEDSVAFLCGPPAMIQRAVLPALKDWGYEEDKNVYGF